MENAVTINFQGALDDRLLDAIPAGVNIIDRNFIIQKVNRWMTEKFSDKMPLVGQKCHYATHNCDTNHAECPSVKAIKSGHPESSTIMLDIADESIWAQVTSFPLKDKNQHIYGCIEYIVDVSEKKRDEQLQNVMLEISNALHNTINTTDLIRKIRDILSRIIDTSNFFIALYDAETDSFRLPFFADDRDEFNVFPAGRTLTRRVVEGGVPLLLYEKDMQQLFDDGVVDLFGSASKVWLGVPLINKNVTFGAVVVQSYTDANAFGQKDLDILKFVSDQIAIAVERKQTEEKLAYERTLMQALLDNTTDFIFFKDKDGRFIKTSKSHCFYLGKKEPQDVLGKTDFDFYSPELAQEYKNDEQHILQSKLPIIDKEEKGSLAKDENQWFATTKIPLWDKDNDVIGIFGITRNISMQKRSEQELRQSEVQYRTTLNAMQDAIHVVDPKLRIILANDALVQLSESLGLDTDVLGKNYFDVYPFLSSTVQDEYAHVFSTGKTLKTNTKDVIGDRTVYTETRKIPIFENGHVTQVLTVIRDTTNRHTREKELARLAAAVEQAGDSIIIIDKSGNIVYVNPMHAKITGKSKSELIGQPASVLKSDLYDSDFYAQIWQAIAAGKTWSGHMVNPGPNGTEIEQDVTISPVFNANGEIENFIAVSKDVTNEINMQKQLAQAQKMEAIGTLAGGIAHDFNNILASIIGFTQLSQMQVKEDSKIDKNLKNVLKACDRARELTQQILLYSRGDEQEKRPLQISLIVAEAIKLLKASLPATINFTYEIDQDIGFVLGTPTQIHQILMNLVTNSAHALPNEVGQISVDLKPKTVPQNGSVKKYIQLVVSDTGIGIPREHQSRIFDPFFTTKPTTKGTGLGLSVVHGIVNSMGGEISLKSEPKKGTTFEILIPEVDIQKDKADFSQTGVPTGSETILFIDDEIDLTTISRDILTNLGYSVVTSVSSNEGLQLFLENPQRYDMVITDQTMPGITGDELAKHMRTLRPDIPIILCTGYSEILQRLPEEKKFFDKVVTKPFYIDELARNIRELFDAR